MHKKQLIIFLGLICLSILVSGSGCVSKKKYIQLEASLHRAEKQATYDKKQLKELEDAQKMYQYQKKINTQLAGRIKKLELGIKKRQSVIKLQKEIISLLDDTKKTIETSLKDQIAKQEIEVVNMEDKLKVVFIDKILFDSGYSSINNGGKKLLLKIAGFLRDYKKQNIMIKGHTDNVPLKARLKKRFASNWELSTARAASIANFLEKKGGLDPKRLSACGHSYYRPVASNKTEKGRRQNRRIEIILIPVN
ncbi:MAG: flagellar motor protein MotB [Deltaproteobacteria bacterium]|nr:flagellar motor protein MotB [Deltaproteobacteria bacterium]